MVGRVSVLNSRELRATIYAIKTAPAELRTQIRQQTRAVAAPAWQRALAEESRTLTQTRTLVTPARVTVSDQSVKVRSATTKRKVASGGLTPFQHGRAVEFGANPEKVKSYQSRRGATRFRVTRHTARQMQRRNRRGYVFLPAAAEMVPRLLALWTQTAVRTLAEAIEGKR